MALPPYYLQLSMVSLLLAGRPRSPGQPRRGPCGRAVFPLITRFVGCLKEMASHLNNSLIRLC